MKLKDKVIIITGSSIGIGRKMAELLVEQGAKVVLNARNENRLLEAATVFEKKGHQVFAVAGDVSKIEDCKRIVSKTIEKFGQLDGLINNAGISTEGEVGDLDSDVFRKVMEVNYLGSVYPTQAALPFLRKTKGSVIFVSSVAGIRGIPGYAVYSSSKMALTALAESLKIEEKQRGVHVGIAYVGFTENDAQKTIYNAEGKIIPQPSRPGMKQEPVEVVAGRIISMIEKRQFKNVFTLLGKLNNVFNRLFPSLGEFILSRNYFKK